MVKTLVMKPDEFKWRKPKCNISSSQKGTFGENTILLLCWLALVALPPMVQSDDSSAEALQSTQVQAEEGENANTLQVIVVEPTGEPSPELPLGIGVSGKTLATVPGAAGDPLRSIESIPGMAFSDDSEPLPAVRGSRPDDNYFEVDFIPSNYLFHAGGLISVFNPGLVESFSIYPSAYGPEYHGVHGGVFDVRLRDPKTDRFRTSLDISLFQSGMLLEGPVSDNQSFYLAGRFSYLDLLIADQLNDEEESETIVQFPKYNDYQAKYVWDISEDATVRFQANGAKDDFAVDIDEDAEDIATDPILAGRIQQKASSHQQAVVVDVNLSDTATLKTAIAHTVEEEDFRLGGAGNVEVNTDTWLSKARLNFPLAENHDITVGGSVELTDYLVDLDFNVPVCTEFEAECILTNSERIATSFTQDVTSTQLYIKDSWYVTDKLTLFPGITLHTEDWLDTQHIEPKFALEYALSDDTVISAGVGVYYQRPYIEQIEETIGNSNLDFVRSTQVVAGLERALSRGWSFKSELYYKQLEDLVTGDDDLGYKNGGEGSTVGMDTLIRKDLTDRFSGWLSLSLSESTRRNKATGERFDFEFDQPFNASLVASYQLNDKWRVGGKLWLHSGALYTPVIGATPDSEIAGLYIPQYGELNSERFPTFNRLDLRVDRTVTKSNGRTYSAYFEVINLLGSDNVASYSYNADYSEREEDNQKSAFFSIGFKAEI